MLKNYEYVDPTAGSAVELRRKKRIKHIIAYLAAFTVFNTLLITAFALTIMCVKNPKCRLMAAELAYLSIVHDTNFPSFNMILPVEITVKNTNFGQFRYGNSTVAFAYGNVTVGGAFVAQTRVPARSTRTVNVIVKLSSDNVRRNLKLGNDIISGMMRLTSYGRLSGNVHLMEVMEKRKSA